jgi:hypothetical protein
MLNWSLPRKHFDISFSDRNSLIDSSLIFCVLFFFIGAGNFVCNECVLHFKKNKQNWLGHMKKLHSNDFNKLLDEMRASRRALNEAIDNVDDEVGHLNVKEIFLPRDLPIFVYLLG